jgi:uncharacterized protein (UPF0212 family)
MRRDRNDTDWQRDLALRRPNPRHGSPWIGAGLGRDGESPSAYPGTGSSLPQDIGADGFEVEPPPDEERDDLSMIADSRGDEPPADDEFDVTDLNQTPSIEGVEAQLLSIDPDRASRVDHIDEEETLHDRDEGGEMGISSEVSELPIGSPDMSPGELGRYECPNCGFEYDVVLGTAARCPNCNYQADLTNVVGDESFHESFSATHPDD